MCVPVCVHACVCLCVVSACVCLCVVSECVCTCVNACIFVYV